MLDYIIQVLLFQTLFLAVYDLLLKTETFFQWNRAYLIITSVAAYCIPLIKFSGFQKIVPQEYTILLPEVMLSPTAVIQENFDWSGLLFNVLQGVFIVGVVVAFIVFTQKLYRLIQLILKNEKRSLQKDQLVLLESSKVFSFFNYIFIGKTLSDAQKEQVISHELVHVQQKHSLDLFLFEVQKIVCWFNPFSYLFQQRISELHEFIADSKTVKTTNKNDYFQNLLTQTFDTQNISFINSFSKISLIKKRILMLNKDKSKQLLKFKYLLMLPLLLGMLLYSSCEKETMVDEVKTNRNKKRIVSLFMGSIKGDDIKKMSSKKEGYFDYYYFTTPPGKQISYDDLSIEEKNAFDSYEKRRNDSNKPKEFSHEIFEDVNGLKSIKLITNWDVVKSNRTANNYAYAKTAPFAKIDKVPIFPGCGDAKDKRKCFQEKMNAFIVEKFDISLANSLNLKPGKKKIFAQFSVANDGRITYVKVRAPHVKLEDAVWDLIYDLPNMIPGEHNGKKVEVAYMQPISFIVK